MEQRLTQLLHICSRVITIESLNVDAELQQLAPISSLKVSSETLDLLSEYASLRVEQEKAVFQSVYDFYLAYKENLPKSKFGQLVLSVRSQELQVNVSKRKLERTEESTIPQKKYRPEISTILQEWLFKHLGNPYPNKQEKAFLREQTGLSPRQLSQWFGNARRRMGSVLSRYVAHNKEKFEDLIEKLSETAKSQPLANIVQPDNNENTPEALTLENKQEELLSELDLDSFLWVFGKHQPEEDPFMIEEFQLNTPQDFSYQELEN